MGDQKKADRTAKWRKSIKEDIRKEKSEKRDKPVKKVEKPDSRA